jgi:hypothetical protein
MTGTVLGCPDLLHSSSSRRHGGPTPAIRHDRSDWHERAFRAAGSVVCGSTDCDLEGLEKVLAGVSYRLEWVPDLTLEELRERGTSGRALIEEMTVAGVFVFSDGGLDASTAVCSVDPSSGSPVFTDGPFVETKEHLGGFAVVDVPDDAEARYWAGRIAVAVGWPQEVHRFPHRIPLSADTQSEPLS